MIEEDAIAPEAKKELSPEQIYLRNLRGKNLDHNGGMSDRQLSRHLKKQRRKLEGKSPRLNEAFAVLLDIVFDNRDKSMIAGR